MALFGAAQLGAVAHEEREHAICPEHGERIHVGEHEFAATPVPSVANRPAEEAHEDHCVAQFSVDSVRREARPAGLGRVVAQATRAPTLPVASPPIALLDLAPKSSPPVTA